MRATDAPLLLRVSIVFSEPVTAATVNASTVALTLREQPVPGRLELSEGDLVALFVPDDSLVPGGHVHDRGQPGREGSVGRCPGGGVSRRVHGHSAHGNDGSSSQSVSAGTYYTCALSVDGEVYCWGRGEKGQLGYGGLGDRHWPIGANLWSPAVALEAGQQTTCAVMQTSRLLC